jgi:vacuolar-type H+-ATPase subunit H
MANSTTSSRGNEARNTGAQAYEKAKDVAGQAADKAKDIASQAVDKAKDAASSVGEMVSSAASTVGKKADDVTSSAGSGIKQFGDTIREHGPQSGMLGDATKTVAKTTKQVGRYLEEEGLSGMFEDVTSLIKRNPVPAILVGIGLGVLIGRVMRS